ncbi:ABC transporter substrate-binding protein [Vallicoccus soli]|uniref:ABC transporter substrate-binding protein n=1 Tax=Vallicoccus soli TaxID=2339232 RepID=A0A3A3ZGE8_9ACTN|nr:ABC transporter substrate-binding protein [Vallicoccus soli]RJK94296.1 ABC transporter substrate-binding protein [Vallicoccus soli]
MRSTHPRRAGSAALAAAAALALTLTACTSSEDDGSGTSSAGPAPTGAAQEVVTPTAPAGEGCTLEDYGAEPLDLTDAVVGFSQSEREANPFRIAETQSIRDEAERLGVKQLLVTNANSQLSKQIADIQDMLAQGAQFLIVAPLNSDGLEPALAAARAKNVPVLTIDRKINATACEDYLAFLGSDFVEQGRRAADAMIEATGGEAQLAILLGSSGNNVTTDRTTGFVEQIEAEAPGIEIVAQQTGEFARDKGQQVMEQLIQANPDIDAVYAQNDEMALGAIVALKAAGKTPGEDVKVVSIDGTRNAVEAVVDGEINAVIESNPRFGPLAFQTAQSFYDGQAIPEDVIIADDEYTPENAEQDVANAY